MTYISQNFEIPIPLEGPLKIVVGEKMCFLILSHILVTALDTSGYDIETSGGIGKWLGSTQ